MSVFSRRLVAVTSSDVIEIRRKPRPALARGAAYVRVVNSGVGGADKEGAQRDHAYFLPYYCSGHQMVGSSNGLSATSSASGAEWLSTATRLMSARYPLSAAAKAFALDSSASPVKEWVTTDRQAESRV